MAWLILVIVIIVLCFGLVLLRGAPYLPTMSKQIEAALDLAGLKPGQTLLELGCGDGKVLIAAARRGYNAVGYELNPLLAIIAWLRTRRYGSRVQVRCADFWLAKWPQANAIFVFLLDPFMEKLNTKIVQYNGKKVKLVSFAFKVPGKKAVAERDGVYLYQY